ncbi:acetylglutamate kinase [Acidobacteriota bacterium]|nr:acetylglutamate kinase [Acidobacteriota bacterium]
MFEKNPYQLLKFSAAYGRQFRHKIFVIKLSGDTLTDPKTRRALCEQIALLWSFSIRIILVHGGGIELDQECQRRNIPIHKVAGRRITSAEVLQTAFKVFTEQVQPLVLGDLKSLGVTAVGLTGLDAQMIEAHQRPPISIKADGDAEEKMVDFGWVGDIVRVNPEILFDLLDQDKIPVIAPITGNRHGDMFNTNADTIASEIACAVQAEKLFFLLSVPGLLRDVHSRSSLISQIAFHELDALEAEGVISGGMRPKMQAIKRALGSGVKAAHLVSGILPDALLIEVFTNEGSGTMMLAPTKQGVSS